MAVSSTRTFVIGSGACEACDNTQGIPRIFIYERLETARTVTYQEDMMISSRFPIGEDTVLKNQPGDPNGFFMAFTSSDYYNELWTRQDQYFWQPATTSIAGTAANRMAVAASAGFAPHLAVGQASLNTAWISAPSASAFELLGNGNFGEGTGINAGLAKKWRSSNLTSDGRKCGAIAGCYYQFKGSIGENALIKQVVKLNNHIFSSGDVLSLTAEVKTAYAQPNMVMMLTITEGGIVTKRSITLNAPTTDWDTLSTLPYMLCGAPDKLVVSLRNKSAGGNIKVDNVSLMATTAITAKFDICRAAPLSFPVAP